MYLFWKFKGRARKHASGTTVLLKLREHEHGENPEAIAKTNFVNKIKDDAINSTETGHVLLANQSLNLSRSVARELPSMSAMKCAMRQARNQASTIPIKQVQC
jgi:hypothetical protein